MCCGWRRSQTCGRASVDKHVKHGEHPVRLCNYLDVYQNDRISADVQFMSGSATRREVRRFRLAVGDVLVTKDSEDWRDIAVPALVEYAAGRPRMRVPLVNTEAQEGIPKRAVLVPRRCGIRA